MDTTLLVGHLRAARRKARLAAVTEALCLLRDLSPTTPTSGPLAEKGGVFWIEIPAEHTDLAVSRLPWLGYTTAVDTLEQAGAVRKTQRDQLVRWRGRDYWRVRVYEEDAGAMREAAPDRRTFLLESGGQVRTVRGYRGDSGPVSRRGLPVYDARLLVNLVTPSAAARATFLDPFAGIGGLVLEARAHGWRVISCECDRALRHGLAAWSDQHYLADATALPFGDGALEAIATEPPFDPQAESLVTTALCEMARVLTPGGRLALLCAAHQAEALRHQSQRLGLQTFLDTPLDRKGTACAVLAWEKG